MSNTSDCSWSTLKIRIQPSGNHHLAIKYPANLPLLPSSTRESWYFQWGHMQGFPMHIISLSFACVVVDSRWSKNNIIVLSWIVDRGSQSQCGDPTRQSLNTACKEARQSAMIETSLHILTVVSYSNGIAHGNWSSGITWRHIQNLLSGKHICSSIAPNIPLVLLWC